MWTYHTEGHGESRKRWDNIEDVCKAVADWLEICALNDWFPAVRLVKVS